MPSMIETIFREVVAITKHIILQYLIKIGTEEACIRSSTVGKEDTKVISRCLAYRCIKTTKRFGLSL